MGNIARIALASMSFAFAGLFAIPTQANAQASFDDGLVEGVADGLYVIDVNYTRRTDDADVVGYAGCLIISDSGRDTFASVYHWNQPGKVWCGLGTSIADLVANRQAVWQVYSVIGTNGARAYVLKSYVNGRCLTRGHNGTAMAPSLFLWTQVRGDATFCGFPSADELIRNGQATWYLDATSFQGNAFVRSARNGASLALLTISPSPTRDPSTENRQAWASFVSTPSTQWTFTFWRAQ